MKKMALFGNKEEFLIVSGLKNNGKYIKEFYKGNAKSRVITDVKILREESKKSSVSGILVDASSFEKEDLEKILSSNIRKPRFLLCDAPAIEAISEMTEEEQNRIEYLGNIDDEDTYPNADVIIGLDMNENWEMYDRIKELFDADIAKPFIKEMPKPVGAPDGFEYTGPINVQELASAEAESKPLPTMPLMDTAKPVTAEVFSAPVLNRDSSKNPSLSPQPTAPLNQSDTQFVNPMSVMGLQNDELALNPTSPVMSEAFQIPEVKETTGREEAVVENVPQSINEYEIQLRAYQKSFEEEWNKREDEIEETLKEYNNLSEENEALREEVDNANSMLESTLGQLESLQNEINNNKISGEIDLASAMMEFQKNYKALAGDLEFVKDKFNKEAQGALEEKAKENKELKKKIQRLTTENRIQSEQLGDAISERDSYAAQVLKIQSIFQVNNEMPNTKKKKKNIQTHQSESAEEAEE